VDWDHADQPDWEVEDLVRFNSWIAYKLPFEHRTWNQGLCKQRFLANSYLVMIAKTAVPLCFKLFCASTFPISVGSHTDFKFPSMFCAMNTPVCSVQ